MTTVTMYHPVTILYSTGDTCPLGPLGLQLIRDNCSKSPIPWQPTQHGDTSPGFAAVLLLHILLIPLESSLYNISFRSGLSLSLSFLELSPHLALYSFSFSLQYICTVHVKGHWHKIFKQFWHAKGMIGNICLKLLALYSISNKQFKKCIFFKKMFLIVLNWLKRHKVADLLQNHKK